MLTFEDPAQSSEVHLIGTVEDHHILAQTPAHVFSGLSLACTCRAGRCPSKGHTQSLGQGDVTSAISNT